MTETYSRRQALAAAALGLPPFVAACSSGSSTSSSGVTVDATTVHVTVGQPMHEKLKATGGSAPYRWRVVSGQAPGVTIGSDGTISGTVQRPGTWDIAVEATDSTNNSSGPIALTISTSRKGGISPDVVAIGTSLTARLSKDGRVVVTPWVEQWNGVTGYEGLNLARAGRNSVAIASYLGAMPWYTTQQVTIPASGSVLVPVAWEVDKATTPGTFGDIAGSISRKPFETDPRGTVAQFTRTTPGKPVTLPSGTPLQRHRTDMNWGNRVIFIEASRNDFLREEDYAKLPPIYQKQLNSIDATVQRHREMLKVLSGGVKNPHVIIVGQPNAASDDPGRRALAQNVNQALKDMAGSAWADPWSWLRTDAAIRSVGGEFTSDDRKQIALANTPPSLRFDGLHPSTKGHTALAHFYWDLVGQRGWR